MRDILLKAFSARTSVAPVRSMISTRAPGLNHWLRGYRWRALPGDTVAGAVVAVMLVPQGMAYALLAGLPPQAGLYASILPALLYGLLGSSRALSVGPVAIVSLLVAQSIATQQPADTATYAELALVLALLVGLLLIIMSTLRLGVLVNFLSPPVLAGFTSAAALVIALSQLEHLFGISVPREPRVVDTLHDIIRELPNINGVTVVMGLISCGALWFIAYRLDRVLQHPPLPHSPRRALVRMGPLVVVVAGTLVVWSFRWDTHAGVTIVGDVPNGLPPLTRPTFDWDVWRALLLSALTIAFVGYMESISIAKALAHKCRQTVNANQELLALGVANLGAAFTGAYPVAGSFSRSSVNLTAGAHTGLASIITALLIAVTLLVLTPLFHFMPQAVLGAIVVVSVSSLLDLKTPRDLWRTNRPEAITWGVTFGAVLILGVDLGIIMGIASGLLLRLWITSRPNISEIGRVAGSEHFLCTKRHTVQTVPHILLLRIDASLYFIEFRQ
ncbi:MAG: sulfate permease [Anaerolineae bacterium]|nr:sulfate permease [Anaerolineae bacterium]